MACSGVQCSVAVASVLVVVVVMSMVWSCGEAWCLAGCMQVGVGWCGELVGWSDVAERL